MEKEAVKPKNKLLKLLPRAASSITFQNLPFSPRKNKKSEANSKKAKSSVDKGLFSNPNTSIISPEVGSDLTSATMISRPLQQSSMLSRTNPTSAMMQRSDPCSTMMQSRPLQQSSMSSRTNPTSVTTQRSDPYSATMQSRPLQQSSVLSNTNSTSAMTQSRSLQQPSLLSSQDPTSPKISCMGQIKHRKKLAKNMKLFSHKEFMINTISVMKPVFFLPETNKIPSNTRKSTSSNTSKPGRKSDRSMGRADFLDRAPSLSQMKRFSSCRGVLSKYDWSKAKMGSKDDDVEDWKHYSDEENEEKMFFQFSAPVMIGRCEPAGITMQARKEINLWKRRTIDQPKPIKINALTITHS